MVHESGSPAQSIEPGDHRQWFDGWRIVTGLLSVPFLAVGVMYFVAAMRYNNDVVGMVIGMVIGLCFLAVAGSFCMATLLPSGSGGRGVFTVIGLALGFILALLAAFAVLLFISYQSRDVDHEESWFTYNLGYTAACLMDPGDVAAPFYMAGLEPGWGAL